VKVSQRNRTNVVARNLQILRVTDISITLD
jgi:hypothetical protein